MNVFNAGHLIGGQRIDAIPGHCIERECPGDRRVIVSIRPSGNAQVVNDAVAAAQEAFATWAARTPMDRMRILARFLDLVRTEAGMIAQMMRLEAGKPIIEANGEVIKGIQVLECSLGLAHRLGGVTRSGEGGAVALSTRRRPLGVVALITPYNFPFAVPLWKLAPALIGGNTVVLKGSELTPAVNTKIGLLALEAGFPPGVLNIVQGGREVVEPLVLHSNVRAVSFTGSTRVGRIIHRLIATERQDVIPYQAELGGNNPMYVSEFADIPLAVAATIASKFGSTGQRCTALQRAIVHKRVWSQYWTALESAIDAIRVGLSDDPKGQTMGPLITQEHLDRVLGLVETMSDGEQLLSGGMRITNPSDCEHGYFMAPTVVQCQNSDSRLWKEENFGPLLIVRVVDDFDEGLVAVNDSALGFTAAIFSENRRELQRFGQEAEYAMLHFNEGTAGGEAHVDFGGWKATGIGLREMGDEGIQFFTRGQTLFDSSATTGAKPIGR